MGKRNEKETGRLRFVSYLRELAAVEHAKELSTLWDAYCVEKAKTTSPKTAEKIGDQLFREFADMAVILTAEICANKKFHDLTVNRISKFKDIPLE